MIIASCIILVTIAVGLLTARVVRRRRARQRYLDEPIYGRQQQRAELRRLAGRAVGRAPIDRQTRRKAAREITRRAKEER